MNIYKENKKMNIRYFSLQPNDGRFEFAEYETVYNGHCNNFKGSDPILMKEQEGNYFYTEHEAYKWLHQNFFKLDESYMLHKLDKHFIMNSAYPCGDITDTTDPSGNEFIYLPYVKKSFVKEQA